MAALPTDLTTLQNVKDYMQITDGGSDTVLQRLISSFSQWFLSQLNRGNLVESTYTEQRNGQGGDVMTSFYYPLLSVTSVTVSGQVIPESPDGVQRGYTSDSYSIFLIGYKFHRGRQNVQLNYSAGYPTVPMDIEQAVIDQVVLTNRRQVNLGTTAQTMQGSLTTSFSQKDLAPGVQLVINAYRNRAVVGL